MSSFSRNEPPLVAHVIQHLSMGGLENGLVNLINETPRGRIRHAVICLSHFSEFRNRIRDTTVPVVALGKRAGKDPFNYFRLWRTLRVLRPSIVHSRNLSAVDCAPVSKMAGVRIHVHGEHGWDVQDLYGRDAKYIRYRRWMRPFVDRYVAVSRNIEHWLGESIGVQADRVEQIYNGVDTNRFRPRISRSTVFSEAPFVKPDDVLVVGTVGRLQEVKDPLTLVRAFARAALESPEARRRLRLVMVGDGPFRDRVTQELVHAGVADLAWLTGARNDVPELLRTIDVFASSSLNEGISNGILEAMASGLPVVATAVGGNPELVVAGETGELVPPGNPAEFSAMIRAYLSDPARLAAHGRAARARAAERFSIATMVDRYLSMYEALVRTNALPVSRAA